MQTEKLMELMNLEYKILRERSHLQVKGFFSEFASSWVN